LEADDNAMADSLVEIPQLTSERAIEHLVSLLEPLSRIIQPKPYGVEHLPGDGSLLVGSHTIYGFLALPFIMAEIWKRRRLANAGSASTPSTRSRCGATSSAWAGWSAARATTCAPSCASVRTILLWRGVPAVRVGGCG
jgi:hypothetical protein